LIRLRAAALDCGEEIDVHTPCSRGRCSSCSRRPYGLIEVARLKSGRPGAARRRALTMKSCRRCGPKLGSWCRRGRNLCRRGQIDGLLFDFRVDLVRTSGLAVGFHHPDSPAGTGPAAGAARDRTMRCASGGRQRVKNSFTVESPGRHLGLGAGLETRSSRAGAAFDPSFHQEHIVRRTRSRSRFDVRWFRLAGNRSCASGRPIGRCDARGAETNRFCSVLVRARGSPAVERQQHPHPRF